MSKEKKPMDEVDEFYAYAAILFWAVAGVILGWILFVWIVSDVLS